MIINLMTMIKTDSMPLALPLRIICMKALHRKIAANDADKASATALKLKMISAAQPDLMPAEIDLLKRVIQVEAASDVATAALAHLP